MFQARAALWTAVAIGIFFPVAAAAGVFLPAAAAAGPQVVNLWPGSAPGSEEWTHAEWSEDDTPIGKVIFTVVTPTLTAYLPDRTKASGTGVIIAPGGAFVALTVGLEGITVAQWLQERGVAAFVLKYRITEKKGDGIPNMDMDVAGKHGIADGVQALKVVRELAPEWGLAADRIGFMGFSAGAMVTSGVLLQPEAAQRPAFAAMLYGAPFGKAPAIPPQLPPLFLAWAQDDPMALAPIVKFYEALRAAGHRPEAYIFGAGGHGFGLRKQRTTSDQWIEIFYAWLEAQGLTKPGRAADCALPGFDLQPGDSIEMRIARGQREAVPQRSSRNPQIVLGDRPADALQLGFDQSVRAGSFQVVRHERAELQQACDARSIGFGTSRFLRAVEEFAHDG